MCYKEGKWYARVKGEWVEKSSFDKAVEAYMIDKYGLNREFVCARFILDKDAVSLN